jgi:hypothetical protein
MSEVLSNAELAKEQGNEAFAKKDFAAAVKHYTRAIVFEPAAGYFCNRSAARLSLGHAEWAVEDAITVRTQACLIVVFFFFSCDSWFSIKRPLVWIRTL